MISVNTPVTDKPTSIKRVHVDLPNKLFAGLFYMRNPHDTSIGGDLQIQKFKKITPYGFSGCLIADNYVDCVKTIKYEPNVFLLMINSIYSLHGVTVTSTDYPRYFIYVFGEVKKPLFETSKYQQTFPIKLLKKVRKKTFTLIGS